MTARIRETLELTKLSGQQPDLAQLWITDRIMRLAEYQDTVERINEQIAEYRDLADAVNPHNPETDRYRWEAWEEWRRDWKPRPVSAMLYRAKIEALRTAAEELGQLPRTEEESADPTAYSVAGVSDEELKGALT